MSNNQDSQNNDIRPTKKEQKALEPFFNRFYTLYDEVTSNNFMNESPELRFYKIKELFLLYIEMTNYELIKKYLDWAKHGGRPIFDGIIAGDLFHAYGTFSLIIHYSVIGMMFI